MKHFGQYCDFLEKRVAKLSTQVALKNMESIGRQSRDFRSVKLSCVNTGHFYQMDNVKEITIDQVNDTLVIKVNKHKPF